MVKTMTDIPLTLLSQLQQHDMPFAEFMQQALYSANFGYYSLGQQKFGKGGDFITAPEISPLFAQTLANQCVPLLQEMPQAVIFEFGAGSGRLCIDLLQHLEQLHNLPSTYYIMEVSGNLRYRQQQAIREEIPHLANRVIWLEQWPEQPLEAIVIANEVLDAMPVHRFLFQQDQFFESYVQLNDKHELSEIFKPIENPRLLQYLQNLPALPPPYISEVNLMVEGWLQQCADMLKKGVLFLIDYGFPRHEYYHPQRQQGTLMCHYQHQGHGNFLQHIGQQDITAHVDFTQIAEAADAAGLHVAGFTNQASFLLANDLLSLITEIEDSRLLFNAQQAVKQFTHPSEMGELFKVIALTKQVDTALRGFQLQDKRASL